MGSISKSCSTEYKPKLSIISISMTEGDLADIDTYCTMHSLTRSKFMVQAALEKVQVEHLINSLILLTGYAERFERQAKLEGKADLEELKRLDELIKFVKKEWEDYGR